MGNFNDDYFEGVVLKIDEGFLVTNPDVKQAMNVFYEALKGAKFCTMLPSYQRNLYELENYQDKRRQRIEDEKKSNERALEEQKRMDDRLSHLVLDVSWGVQRIKVEPYYFSIDGKEYTLEEFTTKKGGLTAEAKRKMKEFVKDKQTFIQFCRENHIHLFENSITPNMNYSEIKFSMDNWWNLSISYPKMLIKVYERGLRNKDDIYFKEAPLSYDWNKNEYATIYKPEYLDIKNYELNEYGTKFIKKN